MRPFRLPALAPVAALGFVLSGCKAPVAGGAAASSGDHREIAAAIATAWREHIAAARQKDATRIAALYTDDALYVLQDGREVRGRPAIDLLEAQNLTTTDVLDATHTTQDLRVYGDVAYELGTVSGSVQPHGQAALQVTYHFMAMWQRDGGGWRVRCLVGK